MVTRQEMEKLAKLAHLRFDAAELDALTVEMGEIIAFADTINQNVGESSLRNTSARTVNLTELREDTIEESWSTEEILANVGGGERGYFIVKRSKKV